MAQTSSIKKLPKDILEQLQALLRDPRVTQLDATAQINKVLADQGYNERVSKSAVNRYDLDMREVGAKLQQSRQMAEMWIARLGAQPQGKVGHLVNEMLRTLSFELSMKLADSELTSDDLPGVIKMLKELSLSAMRLEKASSENVKREKEIRKEAAQEAAEAAESVAKEQGLTSNAVSEIKNKILGINA